MKESFFLLSLIHHLGLAAGDRACMRMNRKVKDFWGMIFSRHYERCCGNDPEATKSYLAGVLYYS